MLEEEGFEGVEDLMVLEAAVAMEGPSKTRRQGGLLVSGDLYLAAWLGENQRRGKETRGDQQKGFLP